MKRSPEGERRLIRRYLTGYLTNQDFRWARPAKTHRRITENENG
jgi:hypothetical protein